MNDKRLVAKLDQYAGNVDEIVSTALTGHGADRYGHKEAKTVFENAIGYDNESNLEYTEFDTEYGSFMYALDSSSCDNLSIGIDSHTTIGQVKEAIKMWKTAYGDPIVITVPFPDDEVEKTITVTITGFDFIEIIEDRTVVC